jgi:Na+-driven multidrug efflux pump
MAAAEADGAGARAPPSRLARAIGASVWASFLAACAGTMFFFAFIAPEDLVGEFAPDDRVDRIGVYTLGFFGLWCLAALASALAIYLHGEPAPRKDP